jgi:alanyl-tRNA synthetase
LAAQAGIGYDRGEAGTPFRVIADHIRALVFAVTDGAFPSNEGRGYVLRRLLRRAYRFGREIGFREPFLYKLTPVVIEQMGGAFPEIGQRRAYIEEVIKSEEERFGATLEQGIEKFGAMVSGAQKSGGKTLAGADVFALYDTYGFPMDLTRLMAAEKGLNVDEDGYGKLMERQRERAREARKGAGGDGLTPEGWTEIRPLSGTEFLGYEQDGAEVNVCRYKMLDDGGNGVSSYLLILDKTPFYAESGGQMGDRGAMVTSCGINITVKDTVKWNDSVVHRVECDGVLTDRDLRAPFMANIDINLRMSTRRNHTATHLLQAALRKVLGDHVQQSGSRVDPAGLRFDFTHFKGLEEGEINAVETLVNQWIMDNYRVDTVIKDTATAKAEGATALFGEKYGDKVRVVGIVPVSKELCGGTHVSATGQIGLFHITGEESVSAGVRRINAVTGTAAVRYVIDREKTASALAVMLKVSQDKLLERVSGLIDTVKKLESKVNDLSTAKAADAVGAIFAEAAGCAAPLKFAVKDMGELDKDSFTRIADAISDRLRADGLSTTVIAVGAVVGGSAMFAAGAGAEAVSKHGIHCGELVKAAAKRAGGGGGGKPDRAQAGGKEAGKLGEALADIKRLVTAKYV